MIRNLTGEAADDAAGIHPDNIRDWRRKGFLEGYGERFGRQYLYADQEIFRLAVANILSKSGLAMRAAFQVVSDNETQLDAAFDRVSNGAAGADFYLTFAISGAQSQSVASCRDDAADANFGVVRINASAIARSVIERIPAHKREFNPAPTRRFRPMAYLPALRVG